MTFNIPLIPHCLSQMVLAQADRVKIESSVGKSSVAIYSIAIGLAMTIVTNSINSSFVPWTYQMCKVKQYKNIGDIANKLILLVAGISLVPILMAPEAIAFIAPPEYREAVWAIPPVAILGYCMFVYSLFANIEFYFAENKFVMVASTLAAVGNIVFNYFSMKAFGYMAAGYITLICYAILAIAHYCFMRKVLKKHGVESGIYQIRIILSVSFVICFMAVVCMKLYWLPLIRYGLLSVCYYCFYKT